MNVRSRTRRSLGLGGGLLAAILVATPVLACNYEEYGPSDCGPLQFNQSGPNELTAAVGPCYLHYGVDTGENRAGAYGAVWITGPSGFRRDLEPNCFSYWVCQLAPTTVSIPGPGQYTLVSTTYGNNGPGVPAGQLYCYYGRSELTLIVLAPATPVPTPVPAQPPPATPIPAPPAGGGAPQPTPAPPPPAPAQATPRPTPRPTPLLPLPNIGGLDPGPAATTRSLPTRHTPAGRATGVFLAIGEVVDITGAPIAAGGEYWYPIIHQGRDRYVAAGTGDDPYLVPAAAQASSPASSARPQAPALTPAETGSGAIPRDAALASDGEIPYVPVAGGIVAALLLSVLLWWALAGSSGAATAPYSREDWVCRNCRAISPSGRPSCQACGKPAAEVAVALTSADALLERDTAKTQGRR